MSNITITFVHSVGILYLILVLFIFFKNPKEFIVDFKNESTRSKIKSILGFCFGIATLIDIILRQFNE